MFASFPFLSGEPVSRSKPLARYLPPVEKGIARRWLTNVIPSAKTSSNLEGDAPAIAPWILDPFGAAPDVAVEVAQSGYRLLVAANNPVARFLLEIAANPPSREDLQAALAELSSLRRGDERLEPHIRSLYLTRCDECGEEVMAEAFLWDRGSGAASGGSFGLEGQGNETPFPFARIYHCPVCGEGGEHPVTPEDIERATQFSTGGLHRARALERVTGREDPDRHHVEEALATYLPRAVYALFTLINKLESLPPAQNYQVTGSRRALEALLLTTFDQANSLWPYPAGRARPRQLSTPPRFWEKNIWLALEEAVEQWTPGEDFRQGVPITTWPELPPETGGICLFEGRLKDFAAQMVDRNQVIHIEAVLAALPRPNQAFWTLSALWAGWLWGKESVGPFKTVLRRRRYDWSWHATALEAALDHLSPLVDPGTPYFGLIGEVEPGFLSAALVAADAASFDLLGFALRTKNGAAQIMWRLADLREINKLDGDLTPPSNVLSATADFAAQAARQYLVERGEPADYLYISTAALTTIIRAEAQDRTLSPAEHINRINGLFDEAFSYRHGFLRYGGSHKTQESGAWWLREKETGSPDEAFVVPLSDRVEIELVNFLVKNPSVKFLDLDHKLCEEFPGLFTPEIELIQACLDSYGEPVIGNDHWRLRPQELPKPRRQDLAVGLQHLRRIAKRLEFAQKGRSPLLWLDSEGQLQFALYVIASAVVGKLILTNPHPPERSLLVLPEERVELVAYKLRQDPRLRQQVAAGWRFLSLRQLQWLSEQSQLTLQVFNDQLSQEILEFAGPQMRLL